ncbi:MAG: hypothetical protein JXB47_10685 [Anaerolineae bacterium]|nr:hypothetical protein [Anaerolineae bacterium]
MRRITILTFLTLLCITLLPACKDMPARSFDPPPPTATPPPPPPVPAPEKAPPDYHLAARTPDEALSFLDAAVAELAAPGAYTGEIDPATQVDITAREVRGESVGDPVRRARAAWYAVRAYHLLSETDQSLAWLRPALLDSLEAGFLALEHAGQVINIEGVTGEVSAHEDLDGDGAPEWLVWLRFDTPPHESVALALEPASETPGGYTIMPVAGGWPQVAGGALLVETVSDINDDGRPEIVISTYTCRDTGCTGELLVFGWHSGQFTGLVQTPEGGRGVPLHDTSWSIADADQDGLIELTTAAGRVDTFGWGCEWEDVAMYAWDAGAGAYTLAYDPPDYTQSQDPRCLMTQADAAIDAGEYERAVERLTALVNTPKETLDAFGADFQAFAYFRRGVAQAMLGRPAQTIGDMMTARAGSPFMAGLVDAFLNGYHDGATPYTACTVAAHYAVTAEAAYDLKAPAVYGQLAAPRVCRGQEIIQRRIAAGGWNTSSPLDAQLSAAGIPLLDYEAWNIDADPDPEALVLTQTDFPFIWLFDAQPDGSIQAVRVAVNKRATSMNIWLHDIDGDGADEAYIITAMRDPLGARCLDNARGEALTLRVIKLKEGGKRFDNLLPGPGFVTDCRTVEALRAALEAAPEQITVSNNLGALAMVAYHYSWLPEAAVYAPLEPSAALAPAGADGRGYPHPTASDRAQLAALQNAMLERGDLTAAWPHLEALLNLPEADTEPAFRYETRYLLGRWRELNGEPDAAREVYYALWEEARDTAWSALAKRKLE